ncbi:MAG: hypothetical protein EXR62_03000 [Chloroflexi bacterium]|nr:hypothetical protein [Chloroflexota bacterium]
MRGGFGCTLPSKYVRRFLISCSTWLSCYHLTLVAFISSAFVLGLAVVPVKAQGGPPQVSIFPAQQAVAIGTEFSVTVVVTGATDLGGYQSDIWYDPAVLEFTRFENGPFLSSTGRSAMPVGPRVGPESGRVALGGFGLDSGQPATGDGILARLFFRARSAGTSELTLRNTQLVDVKAQAKSPSLQSGRVMVAGAGSVIQSSSPTSFAMISTIAMLTPAADQRDTEKAQPATGTTNGAWITGGGVLLVITILVLAWMLRKEKA